MPVNTFMDSGTWNIKDVDSGNLVAKVHVEIAATDVAGGRSYIVHWALVKSAISDAGWGVYVKPANNKQWKWETTNETLANFVAWTNDANRKPNLRYVIQGTREQDVL
jgi:hypothetical protein